MNKELIEKWWKDLCKGPSLVEMAKEGLNVIMI